MSADLHLSKQPIVIRNCKSLVSWPCFNWQLKDWSHLLGDTKFGFRVHEKFSHNEIKWENESLAYFQSNFNDFIRWFDCDVRRADRLKNSDFSKINKETCSVYSSYNHLEEKLKVNKEQIYSAIRWESLNLVKGYNCRSDKTTLWFGTSGSYTPLHYDTYGSNLIVQLKGEKRWILFPPEDTSYLYPTRIPYEESSVFSCVNILNPDFYKHPKFAYSNPYYVVLEPGDVLFLPKKWWHFVQNLHSKTVENQICMSMNIWCESDEEDNKLCESIVRFITAGLFPAFEGQAESSSDQFVDWINQNEQLLSGQDASCLVRKCFEKVYNKKRFMAKPHNQPIYMPKPNELLVPRVEFQRLSGLLDWQNNLPRTSFSNPIRDEDIINCVLHPDVIRLISDKLKKRFTNYEK